MKTFLEAVQLVSCTEVVTWSFAFLLKGYTEEKPLWDLPTLLHFLADIDYSSLPMLKYSICTFTSSAVLMFFVLPCSTTFLQLWASKWDCTEVLGRGQRRGEIKLSTQSFTTKMSLLFYLGTDYKINLYSLILCKTSIFNSITAMEIKDILWLRENRRLDQCLGDWSGGPQSLHRLPASAQT